MGDEAQPVEPPHAYLETGDLDAIRKHGILRVLTPFTIEHHSLPKGDDPYTSERTILDSLVHDLDVQPVQETIVDPEERIGALLEGRGDIAVRFGPSETSDDPRVLVSIPVRLVRAQVITRAADKTITAPSALAGLRVAVGPGVFFPSAIETLKRNAADLKFVDVPSDLYSDDVAGMVAKGECDAALLDSAWVSTLLKIRDDLRLAFSLDATSTLNAAVRPGSKHLIEALNDSILTALRARDLPQIFKGDLPGIKQRGILRVLTRNNAACYYLDRGELVGFEYDLARKFAQEQKLRPIMTVPPGQRDLIPWLKEGRGDLIAANMTALASREAEGIVFSEPYNSVTETVVARANDKDLSGPEALAGRTLVVRRSSSYWESIERLRAGGIALKLVAAPEGEEAEQIIARVADGTYDLTVADSDILDIELTWRTDVRAALVLGDPVPLAWAVRAGDRELLAAVNGFIEQERGGAFFNSLARRYFAHRPPAGRLASTRLPAGAISPFDPLARRYGGLYQLDWRWIAAQMYQESRFDPKARSVTGALGLLQVLPSTAHGMGIQEDLTEPELGLHAGVKYLTSVRDRLGAHLPLMDLMAFSLASYNAGPSRVADARRLAERRGLNPDRWYGNVESVMILLSTPQGARLSTLGYCRCLEPVNYVHDIQDRYQEYTRAAGK